jgi:hypothetical protein
VLGRGKLFFSFFSKETKSLFLFTFFCADKKKITKINRPLTTQPPVTPILYPQLKTATESVFTMYRRGLRRKMLRLYNCPTGPRLTCGQKGFCCASYRVDPFIYAMEPSQERSHHFVFSSFSRTPSPVTSVSRTLPWLFAHFGSLRSKYTHPQEFCSHRCAPPHPKWPLAALPSRAG